MDKQPVVNSRDARVDLLLSRAAAWERREAKWHRRLEIERAWDWCSTHLGAPIAAVSGVLVLLGAPPIVPILGALVLGLAQLRGGIARGRLRDADYPRAWHVADRMAEMYRGALARWESGDATINHLLRWSDRVEVAARGELPPGIAAALKGEMDPADREVWRCNSCGLPLPECQGH